MDEVGATVEAEVEAEEVEMYNYIPLSFTMDEPFYVIIKRKGYDEPCCIVDVQDTQFMTKS